MFRFCFKMLAAFAFTVEKGGSTFCGFFFFPSAQIFSKHPNKQIYILIKHLQRVIFCFVV